MSALAFTRKELSAAIERGVRQCVLIGASPLFKPELNSLQVFEVDGSENLPSSLEKSDFDQLKATLVVWLGDAGHRSAEAALSTLTFIASLPRGSGLVLDYAAERSSLGFRTALDALASRVSEAGSLRFLIQPQAVAGMLRGLGFRQIQDQAEEEWFSSAHLVSAIV